MSDPVDMTFAAAGRRSGSIRRGLLLQMRFVAIWVALVALLLLGAVTVPRSLLPATILAIIPLAAFLALTAAGETLVIMARGIDLSIPAIIGLSSSILLGLSHGENANLWPALAGALAVATAIGVVNGFFVAVFELNALIVTLAVGAITGGAAVWYREGIQQESRVPAQMAAWGDARFLGINLAVWVAAAVLIVLAMILRRTTIGRRFAAVGANPKAAWVAGINVVLYQMSSYAVAAFLYGVAGLLLAAFIRNPTLDIGNPYLLAPIAVAVLGGTAISGGVGSMIAVAGAAIFLTQLEQMLKMVGLSSALQFVIEGVAIAVGMGLGQINLSFRSMRMVSLVSRRRTD